jgi:hypothetical protein
MKFSFGVQPVLLGAAAAYKPQLKRSPLDHRDSGAAR